MRARGSSSARPGTTLDTMRVLTTPHRTRIARRGATVDAPIADARQALGLDLTPDVLEELIAIGDREDHATADVRARLARGRAALERELTRALAQ